MGATKFDWGTKSSTCAVLATAILPIPTGRRRFPTLHCNRRRDRLLSLWFWNASRQHPVETWRVTTTKINKELSSARKVIMTLVFDYRGPLRTEFLERGVTINAGCSINKYASLLHQIKTKRRGFLARGVIHHYNARLHTSNSRQAVLCEFH